MNDEPRMRQTQNDAAAALDPDGDYVVRRPFKYGGDRLRVGDDWMPAGGPYDALLVNQGFVRRVDADTNLNQRMALSERRKERKNGTQKSQDVVEDRDEEAYRLYHDEDMTMQEAAEALGVAASTVSRAIKRHEARLEEGE